MPEAIISSVATIAGALIGILASYLAYQWNDRATKRREERTKKVQHDSIRILLRVEMEQNLATLHRLWEKIHHLPEGVDYSDETIDSAVSFRLSQFPTPRWSHELWESQLAVIRIALSIDEIRWVHDFHQKLEVLTGIHSNIAELEPQVEGMHSVHWSGRQLKTIEELWSEYKKIVEELDQLPLLPM